MDERATLLELVRRTRERLTWLARGGVAGLPRPVVAPTVSAPRVAVGGALGGAPIAPPQVSPARVQVSPPSVATSPEPPPAATATTVISPQPRGAPGLALVRDQLGDCRRCRLESGRSQIVFGVGNPEAALVFVGEGPGAEEDRQGEPFVGEAGQLLTRMIAAMGFAREEVYICNVVKCRPPNNRTPEPDEIAHCMPFLQGQLEALQPRILVALGRTAAQALLATSTSISALRGTWRSYRGIPVMPTFHPAYLLRTPAAKREVWSDLQKVMGELDRLGLGKKGPAQK